MGEESRHYRLPTSSCRTWADLPTMETALVTSTAGAAPYDAKAIGEVPLLGVAPAIANAIRDATGVRMKDLPITAERPLTELREEKA